MSCSKCIFSVRPQGVSIGLYLVTIDETFHSKWTHLFQLSSWILTELSPSIVVLARDLNFLIIDGGLKIPRSVYIKSFLNHGKQNIYNNYHLVWQNKWQFVGTENNFNDGCLLRICVNLYRSITALKLSYLMPMLHWLEASIH